MKLLAGPYIGSFEQEVLTFRPHIKWVVENGGYDLDYFVSTHFNRKFLYPEVTYKRFIPIYKQFTRNENDQIGYFHTSMESKDYTVYLKSIKDRVMNITNCNKKDINVITLPYNKNTTPISIYHKIFEPIEVPISPNKGNIVFIPDKTISHELSVYIYDHLCNNYNVSIIGDMSCNLTEQNEILGDVDYLNNGYQKLVTAITNATLVITPCSFWTALANLQNVPVLSWGDTIGPYKESGMYHFNNYKSKVLYHDGESNREGLIRQIEGFINDSNNRKY